MAYMVAIFEPSDSYRLKSFYLIAGGVVTAVLCGIAFLIIWWESRKEARRSRRHGAGQCVNCGYDLRGLGVNRPCPECGSWLSAKLRPPS